MGCSATRDASEAVGDGGVAVGWENVPQQGAHSVERFGGSCGLEAGEHLTVVAGATCGNDVLEPQQKGLEGNRLHDDTLVGDHLLVGLMGDEDRFEGALLVVHVDEVVDVERPKGADDVVDLGGGCPGIEGVDTGVDRLDRGVERGVVLAIDGGTPGDEPLGGSEDVEVLLTGMVVQERDDLGRECASASDVVDIPEVGSAECE